MKTIAKVALSAALLLGLSASTVSADVTKGQNLFSKKLKSPCGITGAAMAGKHTQYEWQMIWEDGELANEIKTICPSVGEGDIKDKFLQHYFDFFHNYASDSGNVPSC